MRGEFPATRMRPWMVSDNAAPAPAMTSAQARLAETIEVFYGAADRTSDGAMAGHAFKSAVEDLDNSVQREMVRARVRARGRASVSGCDRG